MSIELHPKACPICGKVSSYTYNIGHADGNPSYWFRCNCNVIFNNTPPDGSIYDKNYLKEFNHPKVKRKFIHSAWTYGNLIESLTYGRTMLDVGYGCKETMKFMEDRGWLTYGIENNKAIGGHDNIYKGDFNTYDFSTEIDEETQEELGVTRLERHFDLVWLSNVLEASLCPLITLSKAEGLLSPGGVIFISTPDIDFLTKLGVSKFPHWRPKENNVLWNEESLRRELERLDLDVVMCRRNHLPCFTESYNLHIIAQKKYY